MLSNASVVEHAPLNTVVGSLSSTGPHSGAYTYALVSGTGSDDNASFRIVGNLLQTNDANINLAKGTYSIRIRTTDSLGYTLDKSLHRHGGRRRQHGFARRLRLERPQRRRHCKRASPAWPAWRSSCSARPAASSAAPTTTRSARPSPIARASTSFNQLLPGLNYYLVFHSPSGYTFSPQNVGTDHTVDSDANAAGRDGPVHATSPPAARISTPVW